jgi:hypothetical protein
LPAPVFDIDLSTSLLRKNPTLHVQRALARVVRNPRRGTGT